ncbi:MAG: hypothetical protein LJE59_01775 [Chromatiaceae bacterium]|nr:hypothetical protein [Chromatiaceae bacterium]
MLHRLKFSQPAPEVVREGFNQPKCVRLRLERFPRGVDNFHIDVALGPALNKAAATYVGALIRENVQQLWKQPAKVYTESFGEGFRRVLVEHHGAVVKRARESQRLERVQLFQLAVLRLMLDLVDAELSSLRVELEDARSLPARQLSGQSLRLHEQAVTLARHAGHLRFRVLRRLIRELMRLEHGSMRSLRKSVLGQSWPIPEVMLANPLLQLDGLGTVRDFSRIYPIVLHDLKPAQEANRCVLSTLSEWLPASVRVVDEAAPGGPILTVAGRRGHGGARGLLETERIVRQLFVEGELNDCSANWLDLPDNATALLGGDEQAWPRSCQWHHRQITHLQRHLNARLESSLRSAGLLRAVRASYALSAIYPALGLVDAEVLVFEFLRGGIGRRELLRRLSAVEGADDPAALLRRIDRLRREHDKNPSNGRRQLMARFAGDVLRLRRDLKLAWRMFLGMDSIRLLVDEREQRLALANNTLQVFGREELSLDTRGSVAGHVIIKAEVRGADQVAVQMRRRNIDPAVHFSRYFYDPIGRVLERFDAQKVAVEGDSLLFSILEYAGEVVERPAVALACCLSIEILGLVDAMNAENERLGLPSIELGLGIAYADDAPTYLYDHGRKVTISPAIKRARRLSSCHGLLRSTCPLPEGRGLCVAAPVHGEDGGDTLVRYNVNGIELEAAAFSQLHVEVPLRRLSMRERGADRSVVLHAGTCMDIKGESHLLIVRDQPVNLWVGRQLLQTDDEGRRYYEVVTERRLLERVAERLARRGETQMQAPPGIGSSS